MAKKDFQAAIKRERSLYGFQMKGTSFEKYIETIWYVISQKITYNAYDEPVIKDLAHHLASNDFYIDGQSSLAHSYSVLYAVPDNTIVEYDLTDIIAGGWVHEEDVKNVQFEKIIILTEGRTDVEFINSALLRLYPYLEPYYHFINFDEYRVESNASALVKLVISLAASKIKHPIIVLFDNDTTGIMEMKKLLNVRIGENFKILRYPNLPLANKYPTVGPTGNKKMNVNGLACGIELYLGRDTLMDGDSLTPVQWKGYNEKENKYQGEIHNKSAIQDRFREKIKAVTDGDFEDMTLILKSIFNAFRHD
ncbi:MAG: hypothetical protein EOP45_17970 [Sphingobacteriaceae bacterium]|nr:MAG: hypothetical protein EOP45_17970 [Sphingobacteriaceae bacterium]